MSRGESLGVSVGAAQPVGDGGDPLDPLDRHGLSDSPLHRIRRLCMAFPRTEERLSHGECCWFVGGKRMFVTFADHHHDDRVAFWAAALDGVQRHLVEDEPRRFFRPPYVGPRGWIGMWVDDRPDWDRVELLVEEAWRSVAGPRLVKQWMTAR